MSGTRRRAALSLLRLAVVDALFVLLVAAPIDLALHGGTPRRDLEQLSLTAIGVVLVPIIDVIRTWIQWRRSGGLAMRVAVHDAIKDGRLPADADPDTWTRPLVDQQQLVRRGPWAFAWGIAAVLVVGVVCSQQGRLDPIVLTTLAVELAAFVVLLALAVRDRTGVRAQVVADLLDELDERAARTASVARVPLD